MNRAVAIAPTPMSRHGSAVKMVTSQNITHLRPDPLNVAAGAFRPPPKVESAVVRLAPLPGVSIPENFTDIVRKAFSARRKTLRNALPLKQKDYEELGIDPQLRPENLTPEDFVAVAKIHAAFLTRSSTRKPA